MHIDDLTLLLAVKKTLKVSGKYLIVRRMGTSEIRDLTNEVSKDKRREIQFRGTRVIRVFSAY